MPVIDNALLGLDACLHVERCATIQALVEYDAYAPPVAATIIVGALDDFRCHVLTCADNAASHLSAIIAITPIEKAFAVRMLFGLSSGDESTTKMLDSQPSCQRRPEGHNVPFRRRRRLELVLRRSEHLVGNVQLISHGLDAKLV